MRTPAAYQPGSLPGGINC